MNQSEGDFRLKVASCLVSEVFSGKPIYSSEGDIVGTLTIPEYQRPYTWQEKQLCKLLEDLLKYFSEVNLHHSKKSKKTLHNYYLGSIILHQEVKVIDGHSHKRLNVIDGQQRLTSLALLAYWLKCELQPEISYIAPSSQHQITKNIAYLDEWILGQHDLDLYQLQQLINFELINVTLVVTDSEDDAYRFFETQNTGGVRLSGADIIKAHHLRAIATEVQDAYARQWEGLGELSSLLDAVMKVRYWQAFNFKKMPLHNMPIQIKNEVVRELAENCNSKIKDNVAYRSVQHIKQNSDSGWIMNVSESGYAMRQPLNSGINSIDYLTYFSRLKNTLLTKGSIIPYQADFNDFYSHNVIQNTYGTAYLKRLFDSALLLYISQFGSSRLYEAALWLFRMVYSPRLVNKKAVKETTIQAFVRDNHLFDTIMLSFNHSQLINSLNQFSYQSDNENTKGNGAKGGFISRVEAYFDICSLDRKKVSSDYDKELVNGIKNKLSQVQEVR